jgi:hypothetical protein
MAIGRLWTGKAHGTNMGNLFVKLEGEDDALTGRLHFNDHGLGPVVYAVRGKFAGSHLALAGNAETQTENAVFGDLAATATLTASGELRGEWNTSIGSAGIFVLFPDDQGRAVGPAADRLPDQLHTARDAFGAVEIDHGGIILLADELQRNFKNAQVAVTFIDGTEQTRFLQGFKALSLNAERSSVIKLFVQEPEGSGVSRVAQIEFGQQINFVMIQGGDETWVLGTIEKLKRNIRPFERVYTTNFKRLGFGINEILLLAGIIYLPSLSNLRDRIVFMVGVILITLGVKWFHNRFLPLSAIYLRQKPKGLFARFAPSASSWIIAVTAGLAASLLGAYLQGWLR